MTDAGRTYTIGCQFNHEHTFPECFDEGGPAVPAALDVERLATALAYVDVQDDLNGVVGRGRKVDRIVAAYAALSESSDEGRA